MASTGPRPRNSARMLRWASDDSGAGVEVAEHDDADTVANVPAGYI